MNDSAGHRKRVKARVLAEGIDHFQIYEVLEYLLMYGVPQGDTKALARELLRTFGSFARVLEAPAEELMKVKGVGPHVALLLTSMTQFMRRYLLDRFGPKPCLNQPKSAREYCVALMTGKRYEVSMILLLNNAYDLLHVDEISQGTIDQVSIYPRIVVEMALRHQASQALILHNHPGGTPIPSLSDLEVTIAIREALATIDVKLLDHLIIAGGAAYSVSKDEEEILLGRADPIQRPRPPWATDDENAAEKQ